MIILLTGFLIAIAVFIFVSKSLEKKGAANPFFGGFVCMFIVLQTTAFICIYNIDMLIR